MLPTLDAVRRAYAFMKARHRWRRPLDLVGVEEALREAATLAGDRPEDEPAALFYALMRRPMDLADGWPLLAYLVVENHARNALHAELRLDPSDMELRALRMRIIARNPVERARFDDVRAFVNVRIRPRK
jgi:hypothetical protein